MSDTPRWNREDSADAIEQGWEIFCQDEGDPFVLSAVDEKGIFTSDDEAWKFVHAKAKAGDQLAIRALAFIKARSPAEHKRIEDHCK
jgi:hypothetical protein